LRLPLGQKLRAAEWKEIGSAAFEYDTDRYYALKFENDGSKMRALIDGNLVLIYAHERNPEYNESNYRTTVSMPAWREWPDGKARKH
jgi:hypothetical protein